MTSCSPWSRTAITAFRVQHVANNAVAPRAFHRRFRKQSAKCRVIQAGEIGKAGGREFRARGKLRIPTGLRKLVPGADRKAVVAAVDAISHGLAQFARD